MTRFISILLAASLLVLGAAGCSTGGKSGSKKAGSATDTVTTASGLKYVDLKVGTGPTPQAGQMMSVHCTGWLTDGKKFYSSRDSGQPIEFPLGKGTMIKGMEEGVSTMKVGGQRKLIIPPQLGYAERGYPNAVPPNATLIFDVELITMK